MRIIATVRETHGGMPSVRIDCFPDREVDVDNVETLLQATRDLLDQRLQNGMNITGQDVEGDNTPKWYCIPARHVSRIEVDLEDDE